MSHARETEHYGLPLYDGNDIINPLTDFNNANSDIDEALYNANQRSATAESVANDAKEIAEGYDTRVSQAIQTANDALTLAGNTQDMIADDFDPNKDGGYQVGDFVIYNGKLYRFINAHTGAWDASDVQVSPVLIKAIGEVVDEGKQAINDAVADAEEEIAGQTEKVTKTQAMIAQPFDANKNGGYAVGNIVTYADKLYKFTSAHSGAWTGLDVEQVDVIDSVDEKVDTVDEKVDDVNTRISALELGTFVDIHTYTNANPYTAPSDGYLLIGCAGTANDFTYGSINSVQMIGVSAPSSGQLAGYDCASIFVKKGMRLSAVSNDFTKQGAYARFYPLN